METDGEALRRLGELERIYNGPIPEPARLIARHGSAAAVRLIRARGETAFFKTMIRGQIATIRRRRGEGSCYPGLFADLALYRRQWRGWRRLAADLEKPP